MRLPRDVSGQQLASALQRYGYEVVRQNGSHMRLSTSRAGGHRVTVPDHDPMKLGTLSGIISDVARHLGMSKDELAAELFSR